MTALRRFLAMLPVLEHRAPLGRNLGSGAANDALLFKAIRRWLPTRGKALNRRLWTIPYCALALSTFVITADVIAQSPTACGGQPCDAVARGLRTFVDRELLDLGGNGRACADCHMPTDSFQLSPASVEARFQFLQFLRRFQPKADDPLFRSIDADDFRINGDV